MKRFLINICESYDGYEFRSVHVTTAESEEALRKEDLTDYGHEDSGSEVNIDSVKEITEEDFNYLKDIL